ncbi:MAG: polysaccharide deacetylase family protein [Mycoplasmatales bacterium]
MSNGRKSILGVLVLFIVLNIGLIAYKPLLAYTKELFVKNNPYAEYMQPLNESASLYKFVGEKYEVTENKFDQGSLKITKPQLENAKFYEVAGTDLFVKASEVIKADSINKNTIRADNWLPFDESITATKPIKIQLEGGSTSVNLAGDYQFPVLAKIEGKLYFKFNEQVYFIDEKQATVVKTSNTNEKLAQDVPVFMYHFFYSKANGETAQDGNWLEEKDFESHVKYLSENNYYAASMADVEKFIKGQIRLPKKTVAITIDDNNPSVKKYAYPILEKYKFLGTSFVITDKIKDSTGIQSEFVDLASHSDAMHAGGCDDKHGGAIQCIPVEDGVKDLKLSAEKVGGTTVLCYPFGDYNQNAFDILKQAGYTLALTVDPGYATVGIDPYLVPRVRISTTTNLENFKFLLPD